MSEPLLPRTTGDLVVVSPDVGGVKRARAFAKKLNDAPLAIVDKRRSAHNVSEVMNLIGDVKGKVAVLVDDMIDTAGTITNAAKVGRRRPRHSPISFLANTHPSRQIYADDLIVFWYNGGDEASCRA